MKRFGLSLSLLVLAGCPARDDFVLVPEVKDPSGSCGGAPENLLLAFSVEWANGERAQAVSVAVGGHVSILDAKTQEILGPRILIDHQTEFDGMLAAGETVTVDYEVEQETPSFGCAAVCGREVALQVMYGVDSEIEIAPTADTPVLSHNFTLDCS